MNVKPTILVSHGLDGYKVEYIGSDADEGTRKFRALREQASSRSLLLYVRQKPDKRHLVDMPEPPPEEAARDWAPLPKIIKKRGR